MSETSDEYSTQSVAEKPCTRCHQCHNALTNPVPEKWAQRYPAMRGMCRDCAFAWISANVPEDRVEEVA